jgi:hypothetical protein
MARRLLRILPYKGNRDYQYYLDGLKVNGKRKRLTDFSDRAIKTLTVREIEWSPVKKGRSSYDAAIRNPAAEIRLVR